MDRHGGADFFRSAFALRGTAFERDGRGVDQKSQGATVRVGIGVGVRSRRSAERIDELQATVRLDPDLVDRQRIGQGSVVDARGQFVGQFGQDRPRFDPKQAFKTGKVAERAA